MYGFHVSPKISKIGNGYSELKLLVFLVKPNKDRLRVVLSTMTPRCITPLSYLCAAASSDLAELDPSAGGQKDGSDGLTVGPQGVDGGRC